MTNQELKERLVKNTVECEELGRRRYYQIGSLINASDFFPFVISERGAGHQEVENRRKKHN